MTRAIAQQIAGFASNEEHPIPGAGQENMLDIKLTVDKNGLFSTPTGEFRGAPEFRKAFRGVPFAQLPNLPVSIRLAGGYEPEDMDEPMAVWGSTPFENVWKAYFGHGEVTTMYRAFGQTEFTLGARGDLGTHLVLAELADPSLDVVRLIKDAMASVHTPRTPAKSEADAMSIINNRLRPLLEKGARIMIDREIKPGLVVTAQKD